MATTSPTPSAATAAATAKSVRVRLARARLELRALMIPLRYHSRLQGDRFIASPMSFMRPPPAEIVNARLNELIARANRNTSATASTTTAASSSAQADVAGRRLRRIQELMIQVNEITVERDRISEMLRRTPAAYRQSGEADSVAPGAEPHPEARVYGERLPSQSGEGHTDPSGRAAHHR
ncbi:hypothetical protein L1887_55565 [Cichorium endivia]|nr:hypothetical protein L1887_55565 [Cichorium endivia]